MTITANDSVATGHPSERNRAPLRARSKPRTSTFSKLIARSVAEIIVERHSRVRRESRPPIRLAPETIADLGDGVSFTVQTVDAAADAVTHHVVIDREGRVRRIVTPSSAD